MQNNYLHLYEQLLSEHYCVLSNTSEDVEGFELL